jgi:hypothetical protein
VLAITPMKASRRMNAIPNRIIAVSTRPRSPSKKLTICAVESFTFGGSP